MPDWIVHILAAVTALFAAIGAWFKLRSDRKPSTRDVVTDVRTAFRQHFEATGYGMMKAAAIGGAVGGLGVFAAAEIVEAMGGVADHVDATAAAVDGLDAMTGLFGG